MASKVDQSYGLARERYAELGVSTENALRILQTVPISLHCWQGDDVTGFESATKVALGNGLALTGNYPGCARTPDELRADLDKVFALIPGRHRLNLHACYAELGGAKVERTEYTTAHFQGWIDWCAVRDSGLDFNPTFFSHPLATDGFTLAHPDKSVREFWVAHGKACRRIARDAALQLRKRAITNFWIPDGYKDLPADRKLPRERLLGSLDEIFAEAMEADLMEDAVESKLFGLGSESYVVGSHEFYLGYAITRQKRLCLDAGHFHPTETLADKISAILPFVPGLLLHVSRGVRWDSDHVVLLDDATCALMQEIVRGAYLPNISIGLDFFDASINRITAWVLGTRSIQKALLLALLEPVEKLRDFESRGDLGSRLVWMEEAKALPFGAVWDEYCQRCNVPVGLAWLDDVLTYEQKVLAQRN